VTAPHLAPGHTIAGRYTIRAILGFSGEAATYHAVATSGHEVVLKLFDPAIGQRADVMGRLEQVNASIAQLPLQLVVPVADSGYDMSTSAPFVVSERVQHPSLATLVAQQGPLPPAVVARIFENLGQVLDACHARQVAHLALKPTNIFVGPAPDYAVRVCDFGASVIRSTSPTHEAFAKSAPWWSPEQLQPAAVLSAPADVFSAALMAFHALTGRSFWTSCQSSPPDLATWQVEVMAPRPMASQRAAQLGASLPPALDAMFARALSVHQGERPRSVGELAHALAESSGGAYRSGYAGGIAAAPTAVFPQTAGYPPAPGPVQPTALGARPAAPPGAAGYPGIQAAPQVATPGLPPIPPAEPKKPGSLKPVLIGVGAALVLAIVAAVVLLRPKGSSESAASTSEPVSVPAPAASAPEPEATPSASASAPAEAASATTPASDVAAEKVELTLVCMPSCDEILVDNEKLEKIEEKTVVPLIPGKHTVEARKSGGYTVFKETLDVDKATTKEVRLYKLGPAPAPVARPCVRTILKPRCP
jgi:serine/threonine protein kinase